MLNNFPAQITFTADTCLNNFVIIISTIWFFIFTFHKSKSFQENTLLKFNNNEQSLKCITVKPYFKQ